MTFRKSGYHPTLPHQFFIGLIQGWLTRHQLDDPLIKMNGFLWHSVTFYFKWMGEGERETGFRLIILDFSWFINLNISGIQTENPPQTGSRGCRRNRGNYFGSAFCPIWSIPEERPEERKVMNGRRINPIGNDVNMKPDRKKENFDVIEEIQARIKALWLR